jgi:hypothetical protein
MWHVSTKRLEQVTQRQSIIYTKREFRKSPHAPSAAFIFSFENFPLSCICFVFRCWHEVFLTNLWKHLFNSANFTNLLQVSTFMTHIRRCYFFFWDQNTNGRISSRTAHKYEGISTNAQTKFLYSIPFSLYSERRLKTPLKITQYATNFRM